MQEKLFNIRTCLISSTANDRINESKRLVVSTHLIYLLPKTLRMKLTYRASADDQFINLSAHAKIPEFRMNEYTGDIELYSVLLLWYT